MKARSTLFLGRDGLTLIEILISITILAMMMVSVVMVTNESLDHKDAIVREDRELLQIETAFDRINWDFSQLYTPLLHTKSFSVDERQRTESLRKIRSLKNNPLYSEGGRFLEPDFWGRPIPIVKEERKEAIEFYTKANRRRFENSKESEFAWVRYEFRFYRGEDEEKKGLFELARYYAPANIYNSDLDLKELQATILSNKISEYSFFFWNKESEKWERNIGKDPLRGLKIEIKWKRGKDQTEEIYSRTYRTIWPFFEPEDLNRIKYMNANSGRNAPAGMGKTLRGEDGQQ